MSPTVLSAPSFGIGLLGLAVIVKAMGRPPDRPRLENPPRLICFHGDHQRDHSLGAIAWGEERISSGLASILNSTTTLWTAIIIYWAMPSERPSIVHYVGSSSALPES